MALTPFIGWNRTESLKKRKWPQTTSSLLTTLRIGRFSSGAPRIALAKKVWHCATVRRRLYQRCFFILGMLAMLGALITVPLTATYAFAMSGKTTTMIMEVSNDMNMSTSKMPCDGPAKRCPDCPQKVCPDMGSCLVKSFQPLPPLAETRLHGDIFRERVAPGQALITAGALIPPLLRPPSV
jgi:hypothetical protein